MKSTQTMQTVDIYTINVILKTFFLPTNSINLTS